MAAGDISDSMVAQVRARSGLESVQQVTDADIFRFLNAGQRYLGLALRHGILPALLKRASGTLSSSKITLPSDFIYEQILMVGADESVARPIATAHYDQILGNTLHVPSLDTPYYQIWYDSDASAVRLNVYVGNASSTAAYVLDYWALPPDIDTDTDPVVPASVQTMMVEFAVARLREYQRAPAVKEQIFAQLHENINVLNSRYDRMAPRRDAQAPSYG